MSCKTTRSAPKHFPWTSEFRLEPSPQMRPRFIPSQSNVHSHRATPKKTAPENPGRGVDLPLRPEDRVISVVDTGLDGEHRTGSIKQDALGIGTQNQLANWSPAAQADHDKVCIDLIGHLDQIL